MDESDIFFLQIDIHYSAQPIKMQEVFDKVQSHFYAVNWELKVSFNPLSPNVVVRHEKWEWMTRISWALVYIVHALYQAL